MAVVTIEIEYQGELHCEAVHQPSGTHLTTDAPKDNMGKGESFSPTDLVATALGTCMMTVMGIAARQLNVDLAGTRITVQKEMAATPARRIGKLGVKISVPGRSLTAEQKQKLEEAALACPVHKSLHPDVQLPVEFVWG
ncbi:MAG TPA: OsmC family protein [Verrucomicrobiae bacterium]|nr:OsmC family protein [Verrucomicrobiae bacterium]